MRHNAILYLSVLDRDSLLYISIYAVGDCQTLAKGLFLLTNCSRGFRSVRLLVRRQSSLAASLSSSLSSLQRESPEQTALISAVFPRPSKSFNTCQRCCFTNWEIVNVGQYAIDVENVPSGLTFLQAGKSQVRFIFYIYRS